MNILSRTLLLAGALVVSTPGLAHDMPTCDALEDGVGIHTGVDSNLDFVGDDLRFREDGETVMLITEERELYLHGERIELDARGKELVDLYYVTVESFVHDAMDLAGDAAGLGVSAAVEAIAAVFHGEEELEAMEKRIEERAQEIEQKANTMCERFLGLQAVEREMQDVVPGFEPMMFSDARD